MPRKRDATRQARVGRGYPASPRHVPRKALMACWMSCPRAWTQPRVDDAA